MARRAEVLTLDIEVNAKEGVEGVRAVRDEINRLAKLRGFEVRQGKQRKAVERTNRELDEQKRKLTELRRAQSVASSSFGRSSRAFGGFASSLSRGAAAAGPAGLAIAGVGESLRLVETGARIATDAVVLQANALVDATKAALAFGSEITRVAALTGGAAGDFNVLRQAALDGGASTLFSAQQAAEGLGFLAQAGLDARKSAEALPGVLQLAAAGQLSLAKASDISTNILTGYNLEVAELGRVNDVLVETITSTNTNVRELGTAFSFTAGVAASTNQSLEGTTAILGSLANAGIKGSKSGRAVANALSRIIKPTAAGAEVFDRYNIALTESDGTTRQLIDVLTDLEKAGVSSAEVLQIFGATAGRSVVTLLNQGTEATRRLGRELESSAGRAGEFERQLQESAGARVQILTSTLETLAITVGERFAPAVGKAADVLAEQAAALLQDEVALESFGAIAADAVLVLSELLQVGGEIAPLFIILAGAALEAAKAIDDVYRVTLLFASPQTLVALEQQRVLVERFGDQMGRSAVEAGSFAASIQAADRIAAAFGGASSKASAGLADVARELRGGASGGTIYERALDGATTVQGGFNRVLSAGVGFANQFSSALSRLAAEQRRASGNTTNLLDARSQLPGVVSALDIARELDPVRRAFLEYSRDVERINANATDEYERQQKLEIRRLEFVRKQAAEEDKAAKARRTRGDEANRRAQQEAQAGAKALRLEAQRLDLIAESGDLAGRIAAIEADSRARIAAIEATSVGKRLSDQELANAAVEKELVTKQASLAIDEARSEFTAQLARDLDEAAKREEEAQRKAAAALAREQAARQDALALEFERFKLTSDQGELSNRIRAIELNTRNQLVALDAQLAQTGEDKLSAQERQNVEGEKELVGLRQRLAIDKERAEVAKATLEEQVSLRRQIGDAGAAIGGGFGALSGAFEAEQRALDAQLGLFSAESTRLEAAKQLASEGGADTRFLEAQQAAVTARAEALQAEFDQERQNQALLEQRLGLFAQISTQTGELAAQFEILGDAQTNSADAADAQAAALGAAVGIAGALASAGIESAKEQAKVQALINGAASIAAFAAYVTFPAAGNLLTASIQHAAAAAKYALVAGTSSGVSTPSRGASGGSSAGSSTRQSAANTTLGLTSEAGRNQRGTFGAAGGVNYNFDFSSATILDDGSKTTRTLQSTLAGAELNTITLAG